MQKKKTGIIHDLVDPLMPTRFKIKDMLQVIIGATILAIPVGFTQETWDLAATLPLINIFGLIALSIFFISMFTYYHYHRQMPQMHWYVFIKRIVSTYILSFLVVAVILSLIEKAPWNTDWLLAFRTVAIVTLPSSMSAAIADTLR